MRFGYKTVSQMKVTARTAASSEAAIYESSDNSGYSITSNNINTSTVIRRVAVSPGATSTNIAYTAYVPPGPASYNAYILVVAGGGSGAGGGTSTQGGGGGGAGGLIYADSVPMIKGCCQYTVCVGAAGGSPATARTDGLNGSASCFGTLISTVGGGGGGAAAHCGLNGCPGGSGGGGYNGAVGAGNANYCFNVSVAMGTPGQGFRGLGPGGGGAGGIGMETCAGSPLASIVNGGDGLCYFGSYYAGGGAGGQQCATPSATVVNGGCAGIGGLGGGGGGGGQASNGGTAPANTGGGGGGGGNCGTPAGTCGGGGGSGIVIVGYSAPAVIGSGGSVVSSSVTCNGITCCYWCHVYTTSGCYCS